MDDLDCLSRYDGLLQFRINGLGAWCLGLTQKYVPAPPEVRAVLQVLANGDVVVSASTTPGDLLLLGRFAEQVSDYVWHIQPVKLLEALEQGLALADVVAFLEAKSPGPLPQNIAATFRETAERVAQLTDRGSARLVEVQDPTLALLIANDSRLRSLCLLASPAPRMCGEVGRTSLPDCWCRSNPTADRENCSTPRCRATRSTPTGVGKTSSSGPDLTVDGPPPRVSGKRFGNSEYGPAGPPPRVWGKPCLVRHTIGAQRSTPTGVGKTCAWNTGTAQGGRSSKRIPPPRVWGKLQLMPISPGSATVHPHGCGENCAGRHGHGPVYGPPPRVWGKRWHVSGEHMLNSRSTPTGVGKTASHQLVQHPVAGPPPRVWGKHMRSATSDKRSAVHPHGCGEIPAAMHR